MRIQQLLLSLSVIIATATALEGAALKAGVAKADITPPLGLPLWGFANRKGPAKGIRDPLYARVLVLEAGEERFALVDLDLGRVFGPASLERLREAARGSSGLTDMLVAATHTHSGPAIQDEYASGPPAWETVMLEKISQAVSETHQHAVEARLGTGFGVAYIGHNRLRVNPDGTVTWFERNNTMVPTAPVDPTVAVLRIDRTDGQPIAILVNYACHPVVFGSDNLEYSADYPAVTARTVEQAFGNQPLCMFLQGGDGDINPYYAVHPLEQDAVRMRDWTGERLGKEAARIAQSIQSQPVVDATIDFAEEQLPFHVRWNPDKYRQALIASFGANAAAGFKADQEVRLPVAVLLLNKQIALMTMPGEPFTNLQTAWRDRCPVRDAFFAGYTDGSAGYFPTIRAASLGGYGAANSATKVEVGAGERMVDHAIVMTYKMLGRLSDSPEDLKR